ncbi:hypothetical protein JTE90_013488 [Oedothorax gibbosus]|uniref:Rootletin-like coiled-coil domain-containing protein n=1 Tax=Oedothorax gibbosus TaxID=931172 RepID=A0AAV6VL26_9ARAC|nr:hypothetical protein JTE90_013488 [Oedothorax gibbosus]
MAEGSENLSSVEDVDSIYKEEFAHVEEMLVSSREECIEIESKYQDLSLQVKDILHLRNTPSPDSDNFEDAPECGGEPVETQLRYESRISAYHRNQEHQARIVDDLQSRVEEYRLRCAKLEAALAEHSANEANISETDYQNLSAVSMDLETAMIRLEQEKNRCHGLTQINTLLREQLETATEVNQTLTDDIQRLTKEWQMARSELVAKETEWKEEEQTLSQYFTKESNTLLQMWRQVLNFRHDFANLKSHTERELKSFKVCICNSVQNIESVTSAVAGRPEISDTVDHTKRNTSELEIPRLHDKISELIDKNDRIQRLLDEKEKANSVLCSTVEKINDSISKSILEKQSFKKEHHFETSCKQYSKAFEELSQILLSDGSISMSSLFMSATSSDLSSAEDAAVSTFNVIQLQSLINTVRMSLQKYRKQIEESNLEISSLKDQNIMQERTVEFLEDERHKMQQLNSQLSLQFESVTQKMQNFVSELKSDSSVTNQETAVLETVIRSLRDEVDNLRAEKEALLTSQTELRLKMQTSNEEARILKQSEQTLRSDLSRSTKKIADLEVQLETLQKDYQASEDRISQLALNNELVEQEKKKFASHLSNVQTQCLDFQSCVTRLREEAIGVKDSLASLQLLSDGLNLEKEDIKRDLDKALNDLESARTLHSSEKIEFEREKVELRLQLDKFERSCMELQGERDKLKSQLQLIEDSSSNREDEKNTLALKNNELTDQVTVLTSQKQNLESDLAQLREELSRQGDLLAESHGERRTLARTVSELESRAEAAEEELKKAEERLAEAVAKLEEEELRMKEDLRVDEGVEMDEVDREVKCSKCGSLQDQLEGLQSIHEKCSEELAGEKHAHLLRLQQMEEEFQTLLQNERKQHNVDIELLTEEKTALRSRMVSSKSVQLMSVESTAQQDECWSQHQAEVSQLKKQISDHAKEYEEKSVQLKEENKKMHNLYKDQISSLEQEIETLQTKLADSEEWISELKEKMATAEQEHQDSKKEDAEQLKKLKDQINLLSVEHTNEVHNLENKIKDLKQEKESMQYEAQRMELQLTELDSERNKLVKELDEKKVHYDNGMSSKSSLEERLSRIQAQLSEEQSSRDLEQRSLEELRAKLRSTQRDCEGLREELEEVKSKKTEHESTISRLHSKSTELREALREVERSRQEAKREAHALKRNLSEAERRLSSTEHEASELLGLRTREEEIQGELRKEVVQLKQKLMESSATHEATSKELAEARHRSMELEHQLRVLREQHQGALRECLTAEQGLSERRLGLERSLAEASREIQVLGTRLHAEEGKVLALESKVVKLDGLKRDTENRLYTICNLLRSALGSPDSRVFSRSTRVHSRERLTNSRGNSPHRGMSDLDVDLVKVSLKDLIERASATEKERDDLKDVVYKIESELESVRTEHSQCSATIFQLKRELKVKTDLETEFSSKISNINRYEEVIRNLEREKRHLLEKAENAEFYSTAATKERENFMEKLSELKKSELKLNEEISSLTLEKESAEHRAVRLVQSHDSIEGELATLKETLTTKEQKIKSLEQKIDADNKKVKSSESKVKSLESTIAHLRSSHENQTETESILRQKISKLNSSLSQSSSSQLNLSEELERRQKESLRHQTDLFKAQQENEQLKSFVDSFRLKNEMLLKELSDAKQSLSESEKSLQENMQQIRKLQNLLLSSQNQEQESNLQLSRLREHKSSLEDRLKELSGTLRGVTERLADKEEKYSELEKECIALRKFKEKVQRERSRSSEASARSMLDRSTLETSLQLAASENEALQRKVQDLQAKLAELEERHSQRVRDFLSAQNSEKKSEERRLKSQLLHTEQLLKVKEKSHKQQVQGLLEQIKVLTDNLRLEQKRWKQYHQRSLSASANISYLHSVLGDSLKAAAGDPGHLLLPEAERLDTTTEAELGDISLTTPSKLRGRGHHMTSTPKAKRKLDDSKS